MAQMNTDAAVLAKEAANFERISGELKGVIAHVESTAGALAAQWHGQAGTAAQAALVRFQEAAARQVQELNDISANIHTLAACSTPRPTRTSRDAVVGDEHSDLNHQQKRRNDMTEQLWNFAGIEGGAGEIAGCRRRPPRACSTRARVRSRRWPRCGAARGSEAYQAVQMRWDSTSAELNAALQNLAHDHQRVQCRRWLRPKPASTGMFA